MPFAFLNRVIFSLKFCLCQVEVLAQALLNALVMVNIRLWIAFPMAVVSLMKILSSLWPTVKSYEHLRDLYAFGKPFCLPDLLLILSCAVYRIAFPRTREFDGLQWTSGTSLRLFMSFKRSASHDDFTLESRSSELLLRNFGYWWCFNPLFCQIILKVWKLIVNCFLGCAWQFEVYSR